MGLASSYGVCVIAMGLGHLQKKKYGANLTGFSTVAVAVASVLTPQKIKRGVITDTNTVKK